MYPPNYILSYNAFPQIYQKLVSQHAEKKIIQIAKAIKEKHLTTLKKTGIFYSEKNEEQLQEAIQSYGKIGSQNERIVEISQKELDQNKSYELSENERIGIVCPVYWYNLPMIAEAYLSKLEFQSYKGQYIYAVATYANSCGNMLGQLSKLLAKKGYILSGKYGVKMVDNYVVAYDLADEEKQKDILDKANQRIEEILSYIEERRQIEYLHKGS